MPFADTITVPEDKEITIQSDTDNNWVMSQPNTNAKHFFVVGILFLQDITPSGLTSTLSGFMRGGVNFFYCTIIKMCKGHMNIKKHKIW